MKNRISPFYIFICAFASFVGGAFIHDFSGSAVITWITTLSFLAVSIVFLYRSLAFHQQAQKAFLFFTVISLILSVLGTYFALILEGLESFSVVQAFETPLNSTSDLEAMGLVSSKFRELAEDGGLMEALQFPWLLGYFNNLLSPFKFGFALWSMPGIGYYSLAILAWWFGVIFYVLALQMYSMAGDGHKKNFFLAGMIAWVILPFGLPFDREAIAVVLLGVVTLGIVSPRRLSPLDLISVAFSMLLLTMHRNAYAPLIPLLVIIYILFAFKVAFLTSKFQTMSKSGALLLLLILLFASAFLSYLMTFFSFFGNFNEAATQQLLDFKRENQDLWQQFRFGIPVFDDLFKLFFLVLTPFPYYQMFRDGGGWALIVPPVLISLNVFPIFMFGKPFLVVLVVRKILSGVTYYPILVLISLIFLLPVLSSIRAGSAYLIPSLSILLLWLLRNGLGAYFVKRSFIIYLTIVYIAHFLYILVYQKF